MTVSNDFRDEEPDWDTVDNDEEDDDEEDEEDDDDEEEETTEDVSFLWLNRVPVRLLNTRRAYVLRGRTVVVSSIFLFPFFWGEFRSFWHAQFIDGRVLFSAHRAFNSLSTRTGPL